MALCSKIEPKYLPKYMLYQWLADLSARETNFFSCNVALGDPNELAHPVVNSAPQRRRSPVEGGSIHRVYHGYHTAGMKSSF
jgi:hypothetical protein